MKVFCMLAVVGLVLCVPFGARAEDPFGEFVSPVSNPVNFEDPRATTEVRPVYIYHMISDDFAKGLGANGGDAHILALQLRLALSERFAFIATKSGYIWLRPDNDLPGVLDTKNGWANVNFGMKYAFYRDPARSTMATLGVRYEVPSGDRDVLQGGMFLNDDLADRGDGVMNPFVSALWGTGNLHILGYGGGRIPVDGVDSTFLDLSAHADYRVSTALGAIYPLIEVNWIQTLDGGRRLALNQEGFDFFNLGSSHAGHEGVVTTAAGFRWRLAEEVPVLGDRALNIDLGAAYEAPVTGRKDITDWRVTTDLIFHLL